MIGLEHPVIYESVETNLFKEAFINAMNCTVNAAVSNAGGHDWHVSKETPIRKASEWFLSHYPLLGSVAASFKIIEDSKLCQAEDIHIAAVNASLGEIYCNPMAKLTIEEWKFVLAHEYLHAGLMHHKRNQHRSYARPSRRQSASPDIPRPRYVLQEQDYDDRTFGVVVDTSGSVSLIQLGLSLGAIASYAASKDVRYIRIIFCDAEAYDQGYMTPDDLAERVKITGRGGTILQPGIDALQNANDFPKDGPILIITDGDIESRLKISREHAYLIPKGKRLPFQPKGNVFYFR